jgi:hypothetical protein
MQNNIIKYAVGLFVILTLSLNFVSSQNYAYASDDASPGVYDGRIIISKNYNYNKKNVAVLFEWTPNWSQIYYQHNITQELIANGFTVIERFQFDKILRELSLDQTGAVKKDKDSTSKESPNKDTEKKELTRSELSKYDLKKLGELLGISYLISFSVLKNDSEYIKILSNDWFTVRFINLETAEIEISATVDVDQKAETNIPIIRSVIKAIVASQKLTTPVKDIYINYFTLSSSYVKFLEQVGQSKTLYSEAYPKRYAVVYVK